MIDELRSDWIDDTYDTKLEAFAADHGVSPARVEEAFREHCETFRSAVVDGTSADVVRRLAFHKLEWHPPDRTEPAVG